MTLHESFQLREPIRLTPTRQKDGFAVELLDKANEIFNFVLDAITEAVNWIIDEVIDLFQEGQQVFNDFVEAVEEGIERRLEIIEDGFRYVWEKFVQENLLKLKEKYYENGVNLAGEVVNGVESNKQEDFDEAISQLFSEEFNSTLTGFDETLITVKESVKPIGNIANIVSDFAKDFISSLGEVANLATFIIEAIQKLGEKVMEVAIEVLNRILEEILGTLIDQLKDAIVEIANSLFPEQLQKI